MLTVRQNVAFTCIINFCLNIYYGTLYAYTPEVLPSAHRGTGNGIAIGWNRVMGILSAVIATVADVSCPNNLLSSLEFWLMSWIDWDCGPDIHLRGAIYFHGGYCGSVSF
jgi:hypothetical protein